MDGFLPGPSWAVPTATRFVLWNANRASGPVHPRGLEAGDLTGPRSESACCETDESSFEIVRCWKPRTGVQREFELPVGEDIIVGVPGGE